MSSVDHSADGTSRCRSLLLAFALMVGIALGSLTCAAGMASADSHAAAEHGASHHVKHSGHDPSQHDPSQHDPSEQPTQHPAEHHAGMSCLVAFHFTIEVAHTTTACSDLSSDALTDPTGRAERPEPPVPKNLLTSH